MGRIAYPIFTSDAILPGDANVVRKVFTVPGVPTPIPLGFTAFSPSAGLVNVMFDDDVINSTDLLNTANYSVPVIGEFPISVVGVVQAGSRSVQLTLSRDLLSGGSYHVHVLENTARTEAAGVGNAEGDAAFTGVSSAPYIVSAESDGLQSVRVVFSKAVRMTNPGHSDDSLNPSNYSIVGIHGALAVNSVTAVSSSSVDLVTDSQESIDYELTPANIKDIAGNVVVP